MGAASCGASQYAGTACGVEGGTVLNNHLSEGIMTRSVKKEKLIVFIKIRKKSNG
jgi:hypothetical protein